MKRLGLLVIVLVILAAAGRAEEADQWKVVCDHHGLTAESRCYVSIFTEGKALGTWLGIAVQRLNGWNEIQVNGSGEAYSSAEINAQSDTTIVTDYCYGSYCVFVQADDLVEQFRRGTRADIRLYNGFGKLSAKERVSLLGFTAAYERYLSRIGE
jgi:hypothetical protein